MTTTLRPLTSADVDAHIAGEDEQTVRWLNGGRSTVEATQRHFDRLAENARRGTGKRGFGVWVDGRLAGYVDADPHLFAGYQPGDVNIACAVHPWARGTGVAVAAVELICEFIHEHGLGRRAAIRVEPENAASVRVVQKAGFTYSGDITSDTDTNPDGTPATMSLYFLDL